MPNSFTTNLNLTKPEVGADTDAWGGHINDDLDTLDGIFTSASLTPVSMVIKSTTKFVDATTTSKAVRLSLTAINTTTVRTITLIDADMTLVGLTNAQTLTNKTLTDAVVNTQTPGNNTTKAASTAYVDTAVATHNTSDWHLIQTNNPAAATVSDITGISTSINHLRIVAELTVGTDGASILMQTYGVDGVLDTGASDYSWWGLTVNSDTVTGAAGATTSSIAIIGGMDSATPWGGEITLDANNIQRATYTKFLYTSIWLDLGGIIGKVFNGGGSRNEADSISGLRFKTDTGTMTGKISVYGSP